MGGSAASISQAVSKIYLFDQFIKFINSGFFYGYKAVINFLQKAGGLVLPKCQINSIMEM